MLLKARAPMRAIAAALGSSDEPEVTGSVAE